MVGKKSLNDCCKSIRSISRGFNLATGSVETHGHDEHEVHAHEEVTAGEQGLSTTSNLVAAILYLREGIFEGKTSSFPDSERLLGLVHSTGRKDESVLGHLALFIGEPGSVVGCHVQVVMSANATRTRRTCTDPSWEDRSSRGLRRESKRPPRSRELQEGTKVRL